MIGTYTAGCLRKNRFRCPLYFADTSFWIALSSRRDQYHPIATAWQRVILRTGSKIITTEAVLGEWLNALSDTSTRAIAAEGYRRAHRDARIEVVPFDSGLIETALNLYSPRPDKGWSLTDCFSFVVMEQRAITDALTTDRHFEQAQLRAKMLEPPEG